MTGVLPPGPYQGLAPFGDTERDARNFFGRVRERDVIVANLLASRLTVLYGPSGVGKSSVLRAGVVRRLREEPDVHVALVDHWSGDAAGALRAAVGAAPEGSLVCLLLDQFEECFVYHGRETAPGSVVDVIASLVTGDRPVDVLLSLREDAVAQLDVFKARLPDVLGNALRLSHLDRESARAAIEGPLRRWNESVATTERVEIEPALVEAVLDQTAAGRVEIADAPRDLRSDSPGGAVEAPFLQLVMERLWEAEWEPGSRVLRLETLRRLGGAEAVVRAHVGLALAALDDSAQDVAAAVFHQLVTPTGGKVAHRAGDLSEYADVEEARLLPVLETLVRQRILRAVDPGGGRRYEIFHDVLADSVLGWRATRALERERASAARRHRRLLGIAVAALVALAGMTAIALYVVSERNHARDETRRAQAREMEVSAVLGIEQGSEQGLVDAVRAARLDPGVQSERLLREAMSEIRLERSFDTPGPVDLLRWSRDGSRLVVAGGSRRIRVFDATGHLRMAYLDPDEVTAAALGPRDLIVSGDADGSVHVRRLGRLARLDLKGRGRILWVGTDAEGGRIAAVSAAGVAWVWERNGTLVRELPHPGAVLTAALDRSGTQLVTVAREWRRGAELQRARIYALADGSLVREIPQRDVRAVAYSADGTAVATAGGKSGALLWDVRTGRLVRRLVNAGKDARDIAFSPDGTLVAIAGGDGGTRVWTVATGARLEHLVGPTGSVVDVDWSPDGRVLAGASRDQTARLWAVAGLVQVGGEIALLPGNAGGATAVAFDPKGARVATASADGGVRIWDARPDERLTILGRHRGGVAAAAFLSDGTTVVSAGFDGSARAWDAGRRKQVAALQLPAAGTGVAVSPTGSVAAITDARGGVVLWDPRAEAADARRLDARNVAVARFTPDGRTLVTGTRLGRVQAWDVGSGRPRWTTPVVGRIAGIAVDATGRLVAVSTPAGVSVLDAADGRYVRDLGVRLGAGPLDFAPTGSRLAIGGVDGVGRLWDAAEGGTVAMLRGHRGALTAIAFSHDGTRILTTGTDADGRIWSVATGEQLLLLRGQFGRLAGGAFSADDRWVATAGPISAVLWPADTGEILFYLRGHTRALTVATFAPVGWRLLTAAVDGTVQLYDCAVCADVDTLERNALARLERIGVAPSR